MRITAVTCVKNEGPFLLEWIAFHRLIGVTDFLFYSNDCSDGTDDLLDAMATRGGVVHLPNPAKGRNYQMEALKDASKQAVVKKADWVWVADVDEFLNIQVGAHSFADLIDACQSPQAISVSFQFFANNGISTYQDAPVISQFTRSHNPDLWCAERAIEVKTLVRKNFPLQYYGAHRPFFRKKLPAHKYPTWTDGSGRAVPGPFLQAATPKRIRKFPASGSRLHATLNHYALRSLDSYIVKNDRGDVNRDGRVFDDTYWRERNDSAYEDLSIQRHLPALEAALSDLKSDPEIGALHATCVSRHKEKCAHLLTQPSYVQMHEHLASLAPLPPGEAELMQSLDLVA